MSGKAARSVRTTRFVFADRKSYTVVLPIGPCSFSPVATMPEPQSRLLKSSVDQGILVLTITVTELQGEKVAESLLQELLAQVAHHQAQKVVVNLQNIKYISSVAFRPFLSLRRRLQEAGGRLILCGLSSVVGDVFYTTRLLSPTGSFDAPFEMAKDVAAALARLSGNIPTIVRE
jgi:anti-anti-sigma factor